MKMSAVEPLPTAAQDESLDERICEYLVARGRLKEADLARARRLHEEDGEGNLVPLLTRLGLVSEREMADALSEVLGLPLLSAKEFPEAPPANVQMSVRFLKQYHIVPIAETDTMVTVVVADPAERYAIQAVELATGKPVEIKVGFRSEIDDVIERYYGSGRSAMGTIVENLTDENSRSEDDIEHLRDLASEAPVIRLVNLVIQRAVEQRASDIHIEPFENRLKVRYRIDGVLHEVESPPAASTAAVISRVKIMAKLNIAERRLPQDGRIKLRTMGKEIDLRVSTLPTLYGESVVLRILDRSSIVLDLGQLGFPSDTLGEFEKLIVRPYGMILVTGPTGSGKTTTLYGALEKINSPDKKIITIEDPVEYQVSGVNQIHVKPQIGLTFASGLRSIVRQDPDVIMIGEIRDPETAEIAVQAALTGHLVFSTLHTNDAAGAVSRLLEMGVEDYLLASSLLGVLAQRLVRQVCANCRKPVPAGEALLGAGDVTSSTAARFADSAVHAGTDGDGVIYSAGGCEICSGTGYRGRSGIYELLMTSEAIREQILKRSSADAIKTVATSRGMRTLRDDGWLKVREGTTTVAEVLRVTQEE